MSFSKFNIRVNDLTGRGRTALYNTLSRGLAVLDNSVIERFDRGESSGLSMKEESELRDTGIIAQEGMNEDILLDIYYDQIRFNTSVLKITLLTTLNCNFACEYCYEGDLTSGRRRMSEDTAGSAISWIQDRAKELRAREVVVTYHGGEPLLNIPVIEQVGSKLIEFTYAKGIKLTSNIITNGYHLDRQTAKRLEHAGVRSAKVTLDGPENVHDSLRPLRNGGGTYRVITKNLVSCRDVLSLNIGGNFNSRTAPEIPALLDDLVDMGLGPSYIRNIRFSPIMPSSINRHGTVYHKECFSLKGFENDIIAIDRALARRGFDISSEPVINPCPVVNASDFTINYDGVIYKCPGLVDHKEFAVGNVSEGFAYNTELAKCLGLKIFDNQECRSCSVLPLCLGGCRNLSLIIKARFHDTYCEKEAIEAITKEAVRRMLSADTASSPS